ncbi:MAG: hybrid sensor histidine kinase/response regulator [Mucilaginibacter sp.]
MLATELVPRKAKKRMVDEEAVKILIVDDNENNLLSMEVILENESYSFYKATSGKEALRILLKEEDFSVILLDVKMPIMDGYETAQLILQRDKLKYIPIIFITAQDYEDESVYKGYEAGGVDFILKPINPEILRAKVLVFTELHRKNQLLRKQEEQLKAINEDLVHLSEDLERRVLERTIELENVNYELKSLNLSKDKFISVISHDLRTPLTSLLASSENLSRHGGNLPPERIKMFSDIINKTSKKILNQLNELVDWAKSQREKTNFNPEKINLSKAVTEALDLLRTNAVQKRIKVENNIDADLFVNVDTLMFRSILQNLVSNAIKFTPHGGKSVCVSARPIENMVEVNIQDYGVGMHQDTKELLFDGYNKVSVDGTNQEKGTGLGLLLVKDFVTQHGGTIKVESELGKGTCFSFTIPSA